VLHLVYLSWREPFNILSGVVSGCVVSSCIGMHVWVRLFEPLSRLVSEPPSFTKQAPAPAPPRPARRPPGAEISEQNVQALVGMGFAEESARSALQRSDDNMSVAAQLLLDG